MPRQAGSRQVALAEQAIIAQLREFGLEVEQQSFAASPRRLYAGSLLGAGLGWVALGILPLLVLPVTGWLVSLIGLTSIAAVSLIATGIAMGALPFDAPVVQCSNLVGSRGKRPAFWVVAHSDTKAQWLSLRGRIVATSFLVLGLVIAICALLVRIAGPLPWFVAVPSVAVLLVGAAGLSRSPLHGESPGAVDNGSGVIAALSAAQQLSDVDDVGVLITGAEEFGMLGARVWAQTAVEGERFINFDGIDGSGQFNVMSHRPFRLRAASEESQTVHHVVCESLRDRGQTVRDRALPFGIFVDGGILAGAGLGGVTVSRGTWSTLGVIHTPRDTLDRTDMTSAVEAGVAAAEAVRRLLG